MWRFIHMIYKEKIGNIENIANIISDIFTTRHLFPFSFRSDVWSNRCTVLSVTLAMKASAEKGTSCGRHFPAQRYGGRCTPLPLFT